MMRFIILLGLLAATPLALRADAAGKDCAKCPVTAAKAAAAEKKACADKAAACADKAAACADKADCDKVQQVALRVEGLACKASSEKVSLALASLKGVENKGVCTKSHKVSLAFHPAETNKKQLVAAIQKAGFKVQGEEVQLKMSSLACGACSSKVNKALEKVAGVTEKEVCHKGKNAVVLFDPAKTDRAKIVAAINATGFKVDAE